MNVIPEEKPTENLTDAEAKLFVDEAFEKKTIKKDLSKTMNSIRKAQLKNVNYKLKLNIRKGTSYQGDVIITFERTEKYLTTDLVFDFKGEVRSINLSIFDPDYQQVAIDTRRSGEFHAVSAHVFKPNKKYWIIINFVNEYQNDGCGLHSYIDPTDNSQYLYTQAEVFLCHYIFPQFDQPNLKAKLQLTVVHPREWRVISNETIKTTVDLQDDFMATYFNTTRKISTYLYALCAGPYYEHKCQNTYKNIPQSIYVRESLKKYVLDADLNAGEMQEILDKAIEWYEGYFGQDYPFSKYDSIYVPEFNWGAMEHPGCVTFHEGLIFKQKVTEKRRNRRAITITHELAHMWFGNLVTMEWWNDLWLNESFADFICYLCLTKYTIKNPLGNQWVDFNDSKQWGYQEDCHTTTHPIAGPIGDTQIAENAFDGISYSKGAATLRQLCSIITEENFSLALKNYFEKYKWGNATLENLISEMDNIVKEKKIDLDLIQWKQNWICTAGLNTVSVVLEKGGFSIEQGYYLDNFRTIRPHSMKIGLFDEKGVIFDIVKVQISKEKTKIAYANAGKIKAFLPNYDDLTFIRINFSPDDIIFFDSIFESGKNIDFGPGEPGLNEIVFWDGIHNQMCDGKLSASDFIKLAKKVLYFRLPDEIFASILSYICSAINNYVKYGYIETGYYSEMYDLCLEIFNDPERLKETDNFFIILR